MNAISTETLIEQLESMPQCFHDFIKHSKRTQASLAKCRRLIADHPAMLVEIEALRIEPLFGDGYLNFYFSGDGADLAKVWAILRRNSFEPSERPQAGKPKSEFSCWWNKGGAEYKIYMQFSSNVCRQVQVGTETKTVTVPVYEIQCGNIEDPEALPAGVPPGVELAPPPPSPLGELLDGPQSGDDHVG